MDSMELRRTLMGVIRWTVFSDNVNIAGGGYLEFGAFADTDHCALWVDIPKIEIFGSRQQTLPVRASRLIHGHPKVEKK